MNRSYTRRNIIPKLLHVFPTFNVGGAQVRFAQLANAWSSQYHHDIVSMDGAIDCQTLINEEVSYTVLDKPTDHAHLAQRLISIRRFLRQNQPDLMITYNWGAIEWALSRWGQRVPHIHIEDGFGPEERTQQLLRRVWFRRITLQGADFVVVPSQTLGVIAKNDWKIPTRKLCFIPNGVNTYRLKNPNREKHRDLFCNSTLTRIGTLARIRKEKNIPRLIAAFEHLAPEFECGLWIAGDGPELQDIRSRVKASQFSSRIQLTGNIEQPADFLCHLDVFALSSDTEQMPYSVLEAAGAGLPIAAVDVGDVKMLVADENREYVYGQNSESLARHLRILLDDESLRKDIGLANQNFCQKYFDQSTMVDNYRSLFSKLGIS